MSYWKGINPLDRISRCDGCHTYFPTRELEYGLCKSCRKKARVRDGLIALPIIAIITIVILFAYSFIAGCVGFLSKF